MMGYHRGERPCPPLSNRDLLISSVKFEHQHRPLDREHRLALLLVQSLQIGWVTLGRRRFPAIAKGGVEGSP